ncbi:hypothetical protein GNIT_2236 [Glaciecola nitratireducens FR1064]|uniref:Uncharacterized protein n=1 Tax=Glaciecola nitratireducens (strain JCM 12485 / KCTC 12276 / FR1064) TaxID=1085623 RepID=G4QKN6_GLANF|nr:hypothetical protein GNIT_2236 [Glaciecola nitratireducens FR1064]
MDKPTSEYLFLNEMCNTIIACDVDKTLKIMVVVLDD